MSRDHVHSASTPAPELQTIVNAVGNASRVPITSEVIAAILQGKGGLPSHVRTIFSDVSLRGLEQAGTVFGIGLATILDAYGVARASVAAANPELDRALAERW